MLSVENSECVHETFGEEFRVVRKETSPNVTQKGKLMLPSDVNFSKDRKNASFFPCNISTPVHTFCVCVFFYSFITQHVPLH
jgi:hypothetical protein